MLNSNFVGSVFVLRFPWPVYAMLFSARSLDGSLGGMVNGYCAHIICSRFLGICLLWFSGMEITGKGEERNGLDI
jgi:hypothetical protein